VSPRTVSSFPGTSAAVGALPVVDLATGVSIEAHPAMQSEMTKVERRRSPIPLDWPSSFNAGLGSCSGVFRIVSRTMGYGQILSLFGIDEQAAFYPGYFSATFRLINR
jgi:hypothetical protein